MTTDIPPAIPEAHGLDDRWRTWLGARPSGPREAWILIVHDGQKIPVRLAWNDRHLVGWRHMQHPEILPQGLRLHPSGAAETILRISLTLPRRIRLAEEGALAALRQALAEGFSENARRRLSLVRRLEPLLTDVSLRASAQRLLRGVLDAEGKRHGRVLADAVVHEPAGPPVSAHARLALLEEARAALRRLPEGTGLSRRLGL